MTIDAAGDLWVAFWDGWCLRRFSPDGSCRETLQVPFQRPTSCAFAGPQLDRLVITSARTGLSENRSEERRVGKGCVSTCQSRGSPYLEKHKKEVKNSACSN